MSLRATFSLLLLVMVLAVAGCKLPEPPAPMEPTVSLSVIAGEWSAELPQDLYEAFGDSTTLEIFPDSAVAKFYRDGVLTREAYMEPMFIGYNTTVGFISLLAHSGKYLMGSSYVDFTLTQDQQMPLEYDVYLISPDSMIFDSTQPGTTGTLNWSR